MTKPSVDIRAKYGDTGEATNDNGNCTKYYQVLNRCINISVWINHNANRICTYSGLLDWIQGWEARRITILLIEYFFYHRQNRKRNK